MDSQQISIQFPKTKKSNKTKGNVTCMECALHNRFWICEATGKSMNPYYCAKPCKFYKPKGKIL